MTTQAWTDEEWDNLCRAAPDMLKALKHALHVLTPSHNEEEEAACRAIRAAITRAEGAS